MVRGLLDSLSAIPLIMKEQDCTWDEAKKLWLISVEVEAENAPPPSAAIIPFPMDRVRQ